MKKTVFECEFPSDFHAMMDALNGGIAALRAKGWIDEAREPATRLCLEEALVNAIRHGNSSDASLMVRLEIEEGDERCCNIKVQDEGTGFAPDQVADPEADQLGGRGLCLIRHFMDHVNYNRDRRCLEMRLCKRSAKEKVR